MRSDQLTHQNDRYAQAREHHLAILEKGYDLGTHGEPLVSREVLHERDGEANPMNRNGPART